MEFKYLAFILRTVLAPAAAPIRVNGTKNFNILKSTFPDLANFNELVNDAQDEENLFVPRARWGGIPANMKAGRLIIPPPPAIESTKAAMKPAAHKKTNVVM